MGFRFHLVALLLALASTFSFAATSTVQPNIVFVMVDDLDVAVWKNALERNLLPSIKRELVDRGTSFEQMFVAQPLCCPSRSTFHTGQYPQNHGVVGNHNVYLQFKANKEKYALATWLQRAGYRTGYIGKYLNESGGEEGYVPDGWEDWRALVLNKDKTKESSTQCMYGYTLADGGGGRNFYGDPANPFSSAFYQTDVFGNLAADFIGKADSRPFFLVVAPMAPHTENCKGPYIDPENAALPPDTPPVSRVRTAQRYLGTPTVALPVATAASYNEADMSDKPRWMRDVNAPLPVTGSLTRRTRLFNEKIAAMRPVDDMVKQIIDKLSAVGKLDNTLIVFTSDNGFQYGTHRLTSKQDLYEESIRVPMVVRAPGQRTPGTSQAWILNTDWAATIADFAGATPPAQNVVDGRTFRPLLGDTPSATGTRQTLLVRTGLNPTPGVTSRGKYFIPEDRDEFEHWPYLMVRTRNPALTGESDGRTLVYAETYYNASGTDLDAELYDLKTDLPQMASEHASGDEKRVAQLKNLKARLMLLKNCSGDTCRQLEDN